VGKYTFVFLIELETLWKENSLFTPLPFGIFVTLHGVGMDIFWNHTLSKHGHQNQTILLRETCIKWTLQVLPQGFFYI